MGQSYRNCSKKTGTNRIPVLMSFFMFLNIGSPVRTDYTAVCYVYRHMNGVVLYASPTTELHVDQ